MPKLSPLFVFPCLLILTVLVSCSKELAPRQGLVGEYLFKGNLRDNSQYHNHAQAQGATLADGHTRKSKRSAYQFNGVDQFITIPHAGQTNFAQGHDFSISLWVAPDATQQDVTGSLNDIMRKWRGDTQGYPFAIVYYNNTAADSLMNGFSFVRYDGSVCRNSPSLFTAKKSNNGFTHLVCVKEGKQLKLYQNNELTAQTQDTTEPETSCGSTNDCDITIGTRGNKVRFFTGRVDDVRFYNRALRKEEIALLYKL